MSLRIPPAPVRLPPLALPPAPAAVPVAVVPPPPAPLPPPLPPGEPIEVSAERIAAQIAPPAPPAPPQVGAMQPNGIRAYTPDGLREVLRWLPASERMRLLAAIEGRDVPQLTFAEWIGQNVAGFVMYEYARRLVRVLQDVADGVRTRVMVFMPPQLGKSQIVSRMFAAYYLYRFPHLTVGLAGHTATLTRELARDARSYFVEGGGEIAADSRKVSYWRTPDGGGMWSVGIKGGGTGFGFSLGIIDDPFKNRQEAESAVIRKTVSDWYDSVFLTRMRRDASIVVLMTRWHLADLAGYLLAREGEAPERWHVVRFTALADAPHKPTLNLGAGRRPAELDDPDRLPPTVTLEPDWRSPGESVCEERKSAASLRHLMATYGGPNGYVWNAMFQQRPVPPSGGMFAREMFQPISRMQVPPLDTLDLVRSWDLAATEGGGDWTVGVLMGRGVENTAWAGRTFVLDVVRGQWGDTKRDAIFRETIERDGLAVTVVFPRDPAQAGKSQVGALSDLAAGYAWLAVPVSGQGSKALRAGPMASDAGAGYYYIVREPGETWPEPFLRVLTNFGPAATEDDDVDAAAQGHQVLAGRARARARIRGQNDRRGGATAHDRAVAAMASGR